MELRVVEEREEEFLGEVEKRVGELTNAAQHVPINDTIHFLFFYIF